MIADKAGEAFMIYLGVRQIGRFFAPGLLPWALHFGTSGRFGLFH